MSEENKSPDTNIQPPATEPKYLTSEDFNKASSAREARLLARIEKMLGGRSTTTEEEPTPAAAQPSGEPLDAKEARLAKVEAELAQERKSRKEEKARASREEERSRASEILATAGIPQARVKGALAILHEVDKKISRDSDGNIVFKDEEEGDLPLSEGIKKWLSTDEGKAYLPPRGAQGVGLQRGNASVAPRDNPKATAQAAARNALANLLRR